MKAWWGAAPHKSFSQHSSHAGLVLGLLNDHLVLFTAFF
jgi:hypothetical protein